jgi:hypothetical protein
MSDDKLKKLIQSDNSAPLAPKDEWDQISSRMQDKSKPFVFRVRSFAFLCTFLVAILVGVKTRESAQINDQELVEFLFEDDYLQTDNLYSWSDI